MADVELHYLFSMTRPRCRFRIKYCPPYSEFSPKDFDCEKFSCVEVRPEEIEALRLKNIKGLDQNQAAERMGVSQSTFQRLLASAYKKVSEALVLGREIKIAERKE
ncbi:MAG: DUF134 domain-containing protein [Candidatus Doudnabacteria bacterium]|nr:DUF134 domain-containing protein [Candidatus Doudnabacteria bacterium]